MGKPSGASKGRLQTVILLKRLLALRLRFPALYTTISHNIRWSMERLIL